MKLARYRKAIVAALSGCATLAALFWPGVEEVATPEAISAVGGILATVLVYAVPNEG